MTWLEHHRLSERYASEAALARRNGEHAQSQQLYALAAQAEEQALQEVAPGKERTYGITAVSTVALRFKAAQFSEAKKLAYQCLASERLPEFASQQVDGLLQAIKANQVGIVLDDAHMLISIRGGRILHGGAPIDLIVGKYQKLRSMIYRTAEYMKNIPLRKSGEPSQEIKGSYRPWIFQAEPGSYQFTVSVQETRQLNMFDIGDIGPQQVVGQMFGIMKACVESPADELLTIVSRDDYRNTFLKLTRDLAPTVNGNDFTMIEIKSASATSSLGLTVNTRHLINDAIRASRPTSPEEQELEIHGVLRALHLDNDWIEVVQEDGEPVRITRAQEDIDDRIGPMVNQLVMVRVAKSASALRFIDIEATE